MKHIGFSGSREGLTPAQYEALRIYLEDVGGELREDWIGHHGDCFGADEIFDDLCRGQPGFVWMHIHPPVNPKYRAESGEPGDIVDDEEEYLERNRRIVHWSDVVLAAPKSPRREPRSGTWYTFDYALEAGRRTGLFLPNGAVVWNAA